MLFSMPPRGLVFTLLVLASTSPAAAQQPAEPQTLPLALLADSDAGLSASMLSRREKLRTVLGYYYNRQLNTRDHNCWEVMHAIVAYGVDAQVRIGVPGGRPVNAVAWLCHGGACRGQALVYLDRGRITVAKGQNVQGHYGQFLAILAQSKVMTDYSIQLGGGQFTLDDLIESEKLGCESTTELTFKLIALVHYLDSDVTWKSSSGQEWSIPRLIREEIQAPIRGAPCGGTHRLMGLSYAVRTRQKRGEPVDGEYLRAETYINDFHRYTFGLQNSDGSFSTEWFNRRGNRPDLDRRLQTTGHILEWLAYSVPDETLEDPRMTRAVDYLVGILLANPHRNWEIGPLGHALHALALYDERLFKGRESSASDFLAADAHGADETADDPAAGEPRLEPGDEANEATGGAAPPSLFGEPPLPLEARRPIILTPSLAASVARSSRRAAAPAKQAPLAEDAAIAEDAASPEDAAPPDVAAPVEGPSLGMP